MITKYKFAADFYEKWAAQNDAIVDDLLEGVILDNLFVYTGRGVALLLETCVNCWSSCYTLYFAPYKDPEAVKTIHNMWDTFAGAALFDPAGGAAV